MRAAQFAPLAAIRDGAAVNLSVFLTRLEGGFLLLIFLFFYSRLPPRA
jgi:hypothetical protein